MPGPAVDHSRYRLGRSRVSDDPRTVRLVDHVVAKPKPPTSVDYVTQVSAWPMYLNGPDPSNPPDMPYGAGCCTFADIGHQIEAWTCYGQGQTVTISNDAVLTGYRAVSGYDPSKTDPATGENPTDTGCVETDVLNYWRRHGVGGHKIVAYAAVDLTDRDLVKWAIDEFGGIYTGFDLPLTAQQQTVWTVGRGARGRAGSWGGHAIPLLRYDRRHVTSISWGAPKEMTWAFFDAYCDEAYAVITEDFLDTHTGKTPGGLDASGLLAAVREVAA